MKRFGFAIRTGGDPEIADALKTGIERASVVRHSREAVRRVAMMRHTPEEWAGMIEDARVCYGGRRHLPRWAEKLLTGYAMICYGISRLYHWQDRLLK